MTSPKHLCIPPVALHRLRRRLVAAGPGVAAEVLQDAGFAAGESLYADWSTKVVQTRGIPDPGELDATWFAVTLSEVCLDLGWGSVDTTPVGDRAILLTCDDWAEAEPGTEQQPGCYFSCGCFAAFLSALAQAHFAVLEVECRSAGNDVCRFLAGSPETMSLVYDLVAAGGHWSSAFDGVFVE